MIKSKILHHRSYQPHLNLFSLAVPWALAGMFRLLKSEQGGLGLQVFAWKVGENRTTPGDLHRFSKAPRHKQDLPIVGHQCLHRVAGTELDMSLPRSAISTLYPFEVRRTETIAGSHRNPNSLPTWYGAASLSNHFLGWKRMRLLLAHGATRGASMGF